jgi:hypothetical protein
MMMQLTPEQQDEVRKAKAVGDNRVTIGFTAQQKDQWEAAVQEELAGKEENIAHLRKIQAAAEQPDQRLLSEFRAGDAELPAAALERLVDTLGLRLMQEIPG